MLRGTVKKMMTITLLITVSAAAGTPAHNRAAEYFGAYLTALERVQQAYAAINEMMRAGEEGEVVEQAIEFLSAYEEARENLDRARKIIAPFASSLDTSIATSASATVTALDRSRQITDNWRDLYCELVDYVVVSKLPNAPKIDLLPLRDRTEALHARSSEARAALKQAASSTIATLSATPEQREEAAQRLNKIFVTTSY
jgi:hypothetical protein